MPIDTHLKEELDRIDREFGGDNMYKMLGPTLLSYTSTDSSRQYMFTSHIKQLLTLLEPDVPKLQTGFENVIGQYNKAFHELKGTWVVKDIIKKFDNSIMYLVVLYNVDTDTYDIIEKPVAENLTEKFGYEYNTDYMDSLKPGMVVHNEYLYKSTSYDPHMNYRYGKNARVFYSISTDTLEDAVTVRRSWANKITSVEVDDVMVSLNLNDILLNIYGDDDHYKAFPQIGECVKNSVLCATRRINKNHILYDFQAENLRRTYDTDVEYFVSKDAMIYDINVFYNGEEDFPDNLFHSQLKYYYEKNCEYAKNVLEWCDRIKASGSKYTDNVNFFREKFLNYNEYQWKNKDKAFGHIMVEFKVKASVPLETGSKLTGRYGNKGVIANFVEDVAPDDTNPFASMEVTVVDDERMPYYFDPDTGERINVDIMLNMSGSIRRWTKWFSLR